MTRRSKIQELPIEDRTAGADSSLNGGSVEERELKILMIRYQGADSIAVDELVLRLSPRLLRFFQGMELQRSDAEDLLQECWLRIHKSRHTYRASEPLLPWIYAIARHTRLDGRRKRLRLQMREVLVDAVPDAANPEPNEDFATQDRFSQLLVRLPDSQREVILLLKVSGMSLEEVAKATSCSVGAVKQKAHRAYANLRALFQEQGHAKEGV